MEERRRIIKQKIPPEIRFKIWQTYVGNKLESLCFCCKIKKITPFTSYKAFQAGHIKSENDGGSIKIGNLLPICASCNRKMGTRHWDDFVKEKKYFIRVNGGYIKNKNVRFGVNCFAPKPKITEEEQTLMDNATPYPLTPDELKVNNMTHKYKKNLHSILLSPFNYDKWTQ